MLDEFFFGKHLDDDETVSLIVHKYWGTATGSLLWPSVAFLAGWIALVIAPVPVVLFLMGLWILFSAVWWIRNFFDYYLDVWIITDQAIIDLHWEGWFHRQSTRILYSDIQGVTYEIQGIFGTLNRVGSITIEKMSTGGTVSLTQVRNPRKVETLILQNMEHYLHKKNLKDATHVQDLLANFVAGNLNLDDVRKKKEEPKKSKAIVTRPV
jgi:hypothetical protein